MWPELSLWQPPPAAKHVAAFTSVSHAPARTLSPVNISSKFEKTLDVKKGTVAQFSYYKQMDTVKNRYIKHLHVPTKLEICAR